MSNTILRHEALQEIDTGKPFNLVFLTADRRRGTGGEIRELHGWTKSSFTAGSRLPGQVTRKDKKQTDALRTVRKLINVCNPSNPRDHIIAIHWRLMVFFNGKRILQ